VSEGDGVTLRHGPSGPLEVEIGNMDRRWFLRAILDRSGLTQTQLAACLEISREHLNHLVCGRRPIPRHISLAVLSIARVSGVDVRFRYPFQQLAVITKKPLRTAV
jgi:transcriptional regulator with XRE-family HTH domain